MSCGAQVPPPEGITAIAIDRFTGTGDADASSSGAGLGEIILVDTVGLLNSGGPFTECPAIVVEWTRRQDIENEIALQQSRFFDPASRVTPGQLINPSVMVSGNVDLTAGQANYVVELRTQPDGGLIKSFSGTTSEEGIFDVGPQLAHDILGSLCPQGWSAEGGTVSAGPGVTITGAVASLDLSFDLTGSFQGGTAVFHYSPAGQAGGTLTYELSGSGVTGSGEGSYTLEALSGGAYRLEQTATGCVDGIPNSCRTTTEVVTLTPMQ